MEKCIPLRASDDDSLLTEVLARPFHHEYQQDIGACHAAADAPFKKKIETVEF